VRESRDLPKGLFLDPRRSALGLDEVLKLMALLLLLRPSKWLRLLFMKAARSLEGEGDASFPARIRASPSDDIEILKADFRSFGGDGVFSSSVLSMASPSKDIDMRREGGTKSVFWLWLTPSSNS
jgi:hypothetical protein